MFFYTIDNNIIHINSHLYMLIVIVSWLFHDNQEIKTVSSDNQKSWRGKNTSVNDNWPEQTWTK